MNLHVSSVIMLVGGLVGMVRHGDVYHLGGDAMVRKIVRMVRMKIQTIVVSEI